MSEPEIADLLLHSRMHFTYQGASYFLAGCMNVPTVCYGSPTQISDPSKWYEDGKEYEDRIQISLWGNNGYGAYLPTTRVGQYDFEKQKVVQRPQGYVYHTNTPTELESIIKGFPFKVNNKEFSIDD